jgi:hypothetical protein
MTKSIYKSRPIKRKRRTKAEMEALKGGLNAILQDDNPQTVRGVFYQATVRGLIDKTEPGYKVVQRCLADMRRNGILPFNYIADSTRWMRKPETHSDVEAVLFDAWRYYRKAIWDSQSDYVEVWIEKDALAGVIYTVTAEWDVPLMVTRGYSSLSFLFESAGQISDMHKPTYIYCLGDYDPSGVDISRNIEKSLREFAPNAEIYFERISVTPEQIEEWKLPTRPTKKSDSRAKRFKGESVELDAIPAWRLKELVNNSIERHIDNESLDNTRRIENAERQSLENVMTMFQR